MTTCSIFTLGGCIHALLFGWVADVPWWAWAAIALVIVGLVYKFSGWLGVVGLAGAVGFVLGRRSEQPVAKAQSTSRPPNVPQAPGKGPPLPPKSLVD